jgi:biopolymer transport protein ExbB/TolQ
MVATLRRRLPAWGGAVGAGYYLVVASLHYLLSLAGIELWLLRVQHDWISGFSFAAFGAAVGLLVARERALRKEAGAFELELLGTEPDALILPEDAVAYRKQLTQLGEAERALIVVRLLEAALQRTRANWSAADAGEAIKTTAEVVQAEMATGYAVVRYLVWAIPSLGFIGTVLGIGSAIGALKETSDLSTNAMEQAAAALHTAFDTTLVALVLSVVLVYCLHRSEARDERLLARAVNWCMQSLVFRMHPHEESKL